MKNLKEFIKNALQKGLPGLESQLKMAPFLGNQPARELTPRKSTKPSAVLILLINDQQTLKILFTLRSSSLIHHKNQISFPGGMAENNENPIETAFRESAEEIAIDRLGVEILGELTELYIQPSDTLVKPIIGWCDKLPQVKVNSIEVDDIFIVPIDFFLDEKNIKRENWELNGKSIEVPYWSIHKHLPLWGATAMMLNELLDIYKQIKIIL